MIEEAIRTGETIVTGAAKETADRAAGQIVAAAYVEFFQNALYVTGQASAPVSYLAHE